MHHFTIRTIRYNTVFYLKQRFQYQLTSEVRIMKIIDIIYYEYYIFIHNIFFKFIIHGRDPTKEGNAYILRHYDKYRHE